VTKKQALLCEGKKINPVGKERYKTRSLNPFRSKRYAISEVLGFNTLKTQPKLNSRKYSLIDPISGGAPGSPEQQNPSYFGDVSL
jgi:hypothetical protein